MSKRIAVPLNFTGDDMHLIQECLAAVHDNLSDELEEECKTFVRRRCKEVLLKVQDFVVEAHHLSKEVQRADLDERVDDDSSSPSFYRAVFAGQRKKQSLD